MQWFLFSVLKLCSLSFMVEQLSPSLLPRFLFLDVMKGDDINCNDIGGIFAYLFR